MVSDEGRRILRHTLTGSNRDGKVYRNYYCERAGGTPEINALIAKGLMRPGAKINRGADQYFHCTEAGALEVGLDVPDAR